MYCGKTPEIILRRLCTLKLVFVLISVDINEILQDLEVLQEVSAGDFVASDLLFHQAVWGQEERHQSGQGRLKITIDV